MKIRHFICGALFCLGLASQVSAQTDLARLRAQAIEQSLATHPQWINLVHYRANLYSSGYTSFADGQDFFLADKGKTDPQAELLATLDAIFQAPASAAPDEHPQCRFIARYHWLKDTLNIDDATLPPQPCPAYEEWYAAIDPVSVVLVFPSAYINNPSSMFGHTLLRIDPPKSDKRTLLTSHSISYAAETTEFNGLVFAMRGLSGGYAGYFSIQPYYEKVNEYRDLENRDIWEYELNLDAGEIARLMQHTWELHKTAFDYYFLDENCSFQLLTLLDVARPGMDLAAAFPMEVIPVDTVRAIFAQKDLLNQVQYRPASRTNLTYWFDTLNEQERDWVYRYSHGKAQIDEEIVTRESPQRQSVLIDIAYEYTQYQYRRLNIKRNDSANRSMALLKARSTYTSTERLQERPRPASRPDEGHLSSRITTGIGRLSDDEFVQLNWRPAYHDLLDNDQGHVPGAQINFLDLVLRYYADAEEVELESFTLIDIYSVIPHSRYFSALSWKFNTGLERLPIESDNPQRRLPYTINGGAGYTYAFNDAFRVFALLEGTAMLHEHFEDNLAIVGGPSTGLLWQITPAWKALLEARAQYSVYHTDITLLDFELTQSIELSRNHALRLEWSRLGQKDLLQTELLLSWHYYYQ